MFERFTKLNGLISGAKDIVLLSINPAMVIYGGTLTTHLFILLGLAGSLINTRAIMPCILVALIFLRPKGKTTLDFMGALIFSLIWITLNLAYMFMGFKIVGGIR